MIIKNDPASIASYFEDSSNLKGGHCEKVALPEKIDDIVEIIRQANRAKIPVTISGGGTSTTGSRIPFGGIVVSLERLNRIIGVDAASRRIVVESGALVEDVKNFCESRGLFYTSHPTERTAFVGGTVATNSSGARSFKYGPTRKYVKRLKMVLASGELLEIRRGERSIGYGDSTITLPGPSSITIPLPHYRMPKVKNSAGYFAEDGMDLIDLFIGQEGTLSVIAEVELGLERKPFKIFSIFIFLATEKDAWLLSDQIKRTVRQGELNSILSVEYFDSNALDLLRLKNSNVPAAARSAIFIEEELDGPDDGAVSERWMRLIDEHKASVDDTWVAVSSEDVEEFARFRHAIPDAVNERIRRYAFPKLSSDIAVPDRAFLEMMQFYSDSFKYAGLEHVLFGHIGENHLHANVLPHSNDELVKARDLIFKFIKKGIFLGGTVSAEHGIGKIKHEYLEEMYGKDGILEMARIKKAFDPNCILGLDNIFPKEILNSI